MTIFLAKSPVFTHVNASFQGITTIRAFGVQNILQSEFDSLQDTHSSAYFTFVSCSRTFALWIDTLSAIYIALVIYSFLLFFDGATAFTFYLHYLNKLCLQNPTLVILDYLLHRLWA